MFLLIHLSTTVPPTECTECVHLMIVLYPDSAHEYIVLYIYSLVQTPLVRYLARFGSMLANEA